MRPLAEILLYTKLGELSCIALFILGCRFALDPLAGSGDIGKSEASKRARLRHGGPTLTSSGLLCGLTVATLGPWFPPCKTRLTVLPLPLRDAKEINALMLALLLYSLLIRTK